MQLSFGEEEEEEEEKKSQDLQFQTNVIYILRKCLRNVTRGNWTTQ